jgi:hypothetical protein
VKERLQNRSEARYNAGSNLTAINTTKIKDKLNRQKQFIGPDEVYFNKLMQMTSTNRSRAIS